MVIPFRIMEGMTWIPLKCGDRLVAVHPFGEGDVVIVWGGAPTEKGPRERRSPVLDGVVAPGNVSGNRQ
jgi:hypothetical protein